MKLLKTDTYDRIIKENIELKEQYDIFKEKSKKMFHRTIDLENFIGLNLKIRRLIVGKKGSGKTHLLSKTLIPQLSNYFVFCSNYEYNGAYKFVEENNKYSMINPNSPVPFSINRFIDIVKKNEDKVIIIDEHYNPKDKIDILNHLRSIRECNYIIVSEGESVRADFDVCYNVKRNIELNHFQVDVEVTNC